MSLEALLQSMSGDARPETPRASEAESLNILRGTLAALDRVNSFTRGQQLRIKPDLATGIFSRANPVYIFDRYLDTPIDYLKTGEIDNERLRGAILSVQDCLVFGLDDENEAVHLLVSSSWFEGVE